MLNQPILDKILQGDKLAFKQLVAHQKSIVYNLCYKILLNHEDAEEAAQDTFVKVYLSIKSFNKQSKLSTWVYRIAYNTAISKTRKKHLSTTRINEDVSVYEEEQTTDTTTQKKALNKALLTLFPHERGIVVMHYFEGLTVKEISEITGMTVANVKTSLFRSRKKLKKILEPVLNHLAV